MCLDALQVSCSALGGRTSSHTGRGWGGGVASAPPAGIADAVARPRQDGNRPQSRVPGRASAVLDSRPHRPVRGPAGHGGS